jgi:2-oxoglutarate ferredoxin oxidoreductase subunit beta
MQQVFKRPVSLKDVQSHFCHGCHHGTYHRLIAEAMDEVGVQQRTIGASRMLVTPVWLFRQT